MKLQVVSDLHLEFADIEIEPTGDLLILAGDIGVGVDGHLFAKKHLQRTKQGHLYVPGNHEYYHHDIENPNLERFQMVVHNVQGLRVALCTLWAPCGDWYQNKALQRGMNDFHLIKMVGKRLTPTNMALLHKEHREWLLGLEDIDVVVTHYAPLPECVHRKYAGNFLNPAFHGECHDIIEKLRPKVWIHGHMHDFHDFDYEGTRIVCNPRGYVGAFGAENPDFDPGYTIEV